MEAKNLSSISQVIEPSHFNFEIILKIKNWNDYRQYAINKNFSNAIYYYDTLIDVLKKQPGKFKLQDDKLLINIYEDKSKISFLKI